MASAAPIATSNFTIGAEGWHIENGATDVLWLPSGGSAGGYIRASDDDAESLWFFSASGLYLGDQSAAYGGSLGFSLRTVGDGDLLPGAYSDVQLLGYNGVLLTHSFEPAPGESWSSYSIDFVADGSWKIGDMNGAAATEADMLAVLESLNALRIRGDFLQGVETTGLDSVSLIAGPIPEPSTLALSALGLLAVVSSRACARARPSSTRRTCA